MTEKKARGFAALTLEQRRAIGSAGGKAAHAQGAAHRFTSEEGRIAGAKGGRIVAANREHMAEIGRKGGLSGHAGEDTHRDTMPTATGEE